ncbi:MAG: DNA repair protein RecO [Acidobacteria bacterium]|nr:MAG: DNA repair protein RecO [Acidobacteriota bacterium]
MPLRTSEAFILRTYPLKETDRIVSFFTRDFGKKRGVARAARRPKSKFGASLEPLTQVRIQFFERESRDLCSIDHCELLASPLSARTNDLLNSVAISLIAEVADRMLPEAEVSDATYRLLAAATTALRTAPTAWLPLTYYLYWMVRLGGFLPILSITPEAESLAQSIATSPLPTLQGDAAGAAGRELRRVLRAALEDHLEGALRSWPILLTLEPAN